MLGHVLDRKSLNAIRSEVYKDGFGVLKAAFTIRHTPKPVFYDQAHKYPLFFTIKHMRFTVKHMAPIESTVCFIVKRVNRSRIG